MGFFDKAKRFFGVKADDDDADDEQATDAAADAPAAPRAGLDPALEAARNAARERAGAGRRGERPPLRDVERPAQVGVDEALAARAAGDRDQARTILRDIDRGGGLRTLLRAAAALEAGDEAELRPLLPVVAAEEPAWRVLLQVAGALADPVRAAPYLDAARAGGAPAWALAWANALADDATVRRHGLVELLFEDPALARAVAARDLAVPGVVADPAAAETWASFAHGRDSIRRFGAAEVARVLDRAFAPGGAAR